MKNPFIIILALVIAAALVTSAHAEILYSGPINLTTQPLQGWDLIYFDLDQSSGTAAAFGSYPGSEFRLGFEFYGGMRQPELVFLARQPIPGHGNIVWGPDFYRLAMLPVGTIIDENTQYWGAGNELIYLDAYGDGNWEGGGVGYAGLYIYPGGAGTQQYGWARINYDDANNTLTLVDFAVETEFNTAIAAGAIPEPGTVALLFGGAVVLTAGVRRNVK